MKYVTTYYIEYLFYNYNLPNTINFKYFYT